MATREGHALAEIHAGVEIAHQRVRKGYEFSDQRRNVILGDGVEVSTSLVPHYEDVETKTPVVSTPWLRATLSEGGTLLVRFADGTALTHHPNANKISVWASCPVCRYSVARTALEGHVRAHCRNAPTGCRAMFPEDRPARIRSPRYSQWIGRVDEDDELYELPPDRRGLHEFQHLCAALGVPWDKVVDVAERRLDLGLKAVFTAAKRQGRVLAVNRTELPCPRCGGPKVAGDVIERIPFTAADVLERRPGQVWVHFVCPSARADLVQQPPRLRGQVQDVGALPGA